MVVTVSSAHAQFGFDRTLQPACVVATGETVVFETGSLVLDRLVAGEPPESIGLERLNAVTGPVLVDGARPGDALVLEVLEVRIDAAWTVWLPGFGPLGDRTTSIRAERTRVEDGQVMIPGGLAVPVHPMIGCAGVAPAEGVASTLRPVAVTGGNMDLHELVAGAAIVLPVEVDGALVSIGDLHLAMGRAEPTSVALEAAGAATLRISIEPGGAPSSPRLRTPGAVTMIGLGARWRRRALRPCVRRSTSSSRTGRWIPSLLTPTSAPPSTSRSVARRVRWCSRGCRSRRAPRFRGSRRSHLNQRQRAGVPY